MIERTGDDLERIARQSTRFSFVARAGASASRSRATLAMSEQSAVI
jgi:hypothetical protein